MLTFDTRKTMSNPLDLTGASITAFVVHKVGNKLRQEGLAISNAIVPLSEKQRAALLTFLFHEAASGPVSRFTHPSRLNLNEVYTFTREVFENPDEFVSSSERLAKHLYDSSTHPKVQGGEFYCVLLSGIRYESTLTSALGLFKTERKDRFLKVKDAAKGGLSILIEEGVLMKRVSRGCLIVNADVDGGLRVFCSESGEDVQYWRDLFLMVTPDAHHDVTRMHLELCQRFGEELANSGDSTDRLRFIENALDFFKQNDTFKPGTFSKTVLNNIEQADAFEAFKEKFQKEKGALLDEFVISKPAVAKAKRTLKRAIRLDTKMEVRIRGSVDDYSKLIEKGFDAKRKMFFYKLYFNREV